MAHLYPEVLTDAPSSERWVHRSFSMLDDLWTVFHSVAWQSLRHGRQGDGEADFVVLHPDYGLLVLEVKGGRIEIEEGTWLTQDRHGERFEIKNPFEQAKVSKYSLIRYLKEQEPDLGSIPVVHAVVFPDVDLSNGVGFYGPREIILDKRDLGTPATALNRVWDHWGARAMLSRSDSRKIVARLRPTLIVRRTLRDDLDRIGETLVELTQEQIRAFHQIRSNRRAIVRGGAGTGKTILAVERTRLFSRDGFQTLLTCYNSLLAGELRRELRDQDGVRVETFHALALGEARRAGLDIPADPSIDWWDIEAAPLLIRAAALSGTVFDAVVVDEGQDFAESWIEALEALLSDSESAAFYVFADQHQDLYRRFWEAPLDWPTLHLDYNCRNSRPIAKRVAKVYGDEVLSLRGHGKEPTFYECDVWIEGPALIQRLVNRLISRDGIAPDRIAVLSDDPRIISRLRDMLAGDHPFAGYGGAGVTAETIRRFKGLEADLVLLALSDELLQDEEARALVYSGLSRARILLMVFGTKEVRRFLAWEETATARP